MSYLQDYIAKLNILPEQANKRLRNIRELDRKADVIQKQLEEKQKQFIDKVTQSKGKKDLKQREYLEHFYKQIMALHKQCYFVSQQKVRLADQLYSLIHEPTEKLDNDLKRMKTDYKDDINFSKDTKYRKGRNQKRKLKRGKQQPTILAIQPHYCYCGKPSYGEMVQCQNKLCQNEWFHLGCIQQKTLPEKWYCLNCRKNKDTGRVLRNR